MIIVARQIEAYESWKVLQQCVRQSGLAKKLTSFQHELYIDMSLADTLHSLFDAVLCANVGCVYRRI